MSTQAAGPDFGSAATAMPDTPEAARAIASLWWRWQVIGVIWIVASLVILQFDQASITTVGIIIGCMFLLAAVQQSLLASIADHLRWLCLLFGVLFLVAGIIAFIRPKNTFAGMADILGFLFLTVGLWWTIQAF